MEYFGGGALVHVFAFVKRVYQRGIARQVCHDAQFDLRVVGRDDFVPCGRDKGLAHTATFGGADGDVLQIGIVAGQAACNRHRLRIRGVHAACVGTD